MSEAAFSDAQTGKETAPISGVETVEIRPNEGPQYAFLSSPADIAIYGGAAGGGKTYALLLEPTHWTEDYPDFGATIFRRTVPQIIQKGGLWDTAKEIYAGMEAVPIEQPYRWTFPSGAVVEFHHLQLERDVINWQGAQLAFIGFDELTHFSKEQFFYLLSRNRSTCGVRPYVRATCNPDPDSWVKGFIRWWLDEEGRYADPEKAGKLRWMIRSGDDLLWYDSREEALAAIASLGLGAGMRVGGEELQVEPLSVTFIPSKLEDNPRLLERDPGYLAKLAALPRVERERLRNGDWKVKASAGMIFKRTDFEVVDTVPQPDRTVRAWDRAASEPSSSYPDPDWTVGLKMQRTGELYYIVDVVRFRAGPSVVQRTIKAVASQDGSGVHIRAFRDPGQAGKAEAEHLITLLAGYDLVMVPETTKKYIRWRPLAAQAQVGRVKLLRGEWNDAFLAEMEALSEDEREYAHDDQGDTAAEAFNDLALGPAEDPDAAAVLGALKVYG